jgi:hypothetical protein
MARLFDELPDIGEVFGCCRHPSVKASVENVRDLLEASSEFVGCFPANFGKVFPVRPLFPKAN